MGLKDLPDLSDWRNVEVWTIEEAALLWAGIEPSGLSEFDFGELLLKSFDIHASQAKKAKILRRAIVEAVCGGTLPFTKAWEERIDEQYGYWETEIEFPDLPDPDKLIAKKTRVQQAAFLKWAKSKNIPSFREQVRMAEIHSKNSTFVDALNEPSKHATTETPPLALPNSILDPTNPKSPPELRAAIDVWEIVSAKNDGSKGKSVKKDIKNELDAHPTHSTLSNEAKTRISTVVNWDKKGGAPSTPD